MNGEDLHGSLSMRYLVSLSTTLVSIRENQFADVIFAFVDHCVRQKFLTNLRLENVIEIVSVKGNGILAAGDAEVFADTGAPPFMDYVVIPISGPCLVSLVERSIRVAQILDAIAVEFGFVVQYGEKRS